MIWLIFVILALAAAAALFHETRQGVVDANPAAQIFKNQFQELEREERDGLIGAEEARAAKLEIERRLAGALRTTSYREAHYTKPRSLLIGASLLIMGASLGLYAQLGRPDLAPSPSAQREVPTPEGVDAMIAKLEQRLQTTPDDAEGWRMLGWAQTRLQKFDRAVAAYEKAAALEPENIDFKSALAEVLTLQADQIVSPRARSLFEDVLKSNPRDSMAAYYLGIADEQAGKHWHKTLM
jgi:cytochrome c-type biogenesis protein CcmH